MSGFPDTLPLPQGELSLTERYINMTNGLVLPLDLLVYGRLAVASSLVAVKEEMPT